MVITPKDCREKLGNIALIATISLCVVMSACSNKETQLDTPSPANEKITKEKPQNTQPALMPELETNTNVQDLIEGKLTSIIGQAVHYTVSKSGTYNNWQLICGYPQTLDGEQIDYTQTQIQERLAEGTFDDSFCALVQAKDGHFELAEFDFGSTDAPAYDWLDVRGIPLSVIKTAGDED